MESRNRRYSGRSFAAQEIEQIRELTRTPPQLNRQQLSYRVCELFHRRETGGVLKDMNCRVALLRMHREVLI